MSCDHGEKPYGGDGKCDSKDTAEGCEEQAFEENLSEESDATHAHGAANGIFLLPLETPDEEEGSSISACDEKDEGRSTEQRQKDALAVAVHLVAEGLQVRGEALIFLLGLRFSGGEHGQFLLCLL